MSFYADFYRYFIYLVNLEFKLSISKEYIKTTITLFVTKTITRIIYNTILLKSVVVRKLQVAIVARSPREMSQTERIV